MVVGQPGERSAARGPGRPRDAAIDRAVIDATLALLVEQGYEAMGIEGVAARAGVGRPAIYRRWPGKEALVAEALRSLGGADVPLPDTGSVREDLALLARGLIRLLRESAVGPVVGRLVSAAMTSPALLAIFEEAVAAPHAAALRAIVERGIARGELRADLDVDLLLDQLVAPLHYRLLFGGPAAVPADLPERTLDLLFRGVAGEGTPGVD